MPVVLILPPIVSVLNGDILFGGADGHWAERVAC